MKQLQGLIGETDQLLEHQEVTLRIPVLHVGVLYRIADFFDISGSVGLAHHLVEDYHQQQIPTISPIPGLDTLLQEVQNEVQRIREIVHKYAGIMESMTWLCFRHIEHTFPGDSRRFRGGLLCLLIANNSATLQIAFPMCHGVYAKAYEIDLRRVIEDRVLRQHPFSQMPPNFMIPQSHGSHTYVPVTPESWQQLLESTPLNTAPRTLFYSDTADILKTFQQMITELLSLK